MKNFKKVKLFKAVDVAVLTFFTLESMEQRTLKWYWRMSSCTSILSN